MTRKPILLRQNNRGQITNEFSILVTKKLQKFAENVDLNVKAVVRDELERKYKDNVLASYTPVSDRGKEIAKYNQTHKKRQLAAHYHHTGTFLRSIYATVEGNTVVIRQKPLKYDDGTPVENVHEWLTKGTTKKPKYDKYYFKKDGRTMLGEYHPTPKHPFEIHTLEQMKGFLDDLASDIDRTGGKHYIRYKRKKRWDI